LSMVI